MTGSMVTTPIMTCQTLPWAVIVMTAFRKSINQSLTYTVPTMQTQQPLARKGRPPSGSCSYQVDDGCHITTNGTNGVNHSGDTSTTISSKVTNLPWVVSTALHSAIDTNNNRAPGSIRWHSTPSSPSVSTSDVSSPNVSTSDGIRTTCWRQRRTSLPRQRTRRRPRWAIGVISLQRFQSCSIWSRLP